MLRQAQGYGDITLSVVLTRRLVARKLYPSTCRVREAHVLARRCRGRKRQIKEYEK